MAGGSFAPRSLLFVPGDRPDMAAKVPRWSPDATVVDLEDAVRARDKERARQDCVAAAAGLAGTATVALIRVNPFRSRWFADDVRAVAGSAAQGVVLPKYESTEALQAVRAELPDALIVVGLESARGVAASRDLLSGGADAVYFGAEDYIADVGGRRTAAGYEVLHARSEVMMAARLAGISAIDQAVVAVRDDDAFLADAEAGRAIGYAGKICLHPRQVGLSHQVFTPTPGEVAHARRVLEATATAGVTTVGGQMVDEVHVRLARQTLARARPGPGAP
ncbi:MAG: HpcH/HpaI aldolase/citrate lyase family protein [Micromonosporaceae bacterium]